MDLSGARPVGVTDETNASRWVRDMFGRVAHRYDLANHVLSFQVDRYWRNKAVKAVLTKLREPTSKVLDLCCGTGDLMLALESARGAPVMGSDFCHPMLLAAQEKSRRRRTSGLLFEADALRLPFADKSLDLITIAFGFRNLVNYEAGLAELLRVLRNDGVLLILEFTTPPNRLFRSVYSFYSQRVLPVIGGAISGASDAYTYLPDSVTRFPDAKGLAALMNKVGFQKVSYEYLTFGIAAIHMASRPFSAHVR